ncbi:hypothetical protein [Paenibacillus dakarensis]|uniref:hypothetical protein n=1 Tax=Paenibacillus dakarensis TaxID=1527293 RepID=UPI0006D556A2|nr:hypothetical protein [Paenibacillus dakarensis]
MKDMVNLPHIYYGQEEAAELERASLRVQQIYDKTQEFLERYLPASLWPALTGTNSDSEAQTTRHSKQGCGTFQKWVKSPKGWKCIGYEKYVHSLKKPDTADNTGIPGVLLQMIIWSQYEKIQLLHPFLGDEPFYSEQEMDVISEYFVPTYTSPMPLKEKGKDFKEIQARIPLYQEHITAPSLDMLSEGVSVSGSWMTGVDLSAKGFAGLRPYLKVSKGERTYMKAFII